MTVFDEGSSRDPFEGLKVSPQMQRMLTAHSDMSLASASGLASVLRIGPTNIYPFLDWKLDDDNHSRPMSSSKLGATLAKKDYWWLNDIGRRILDDLHPVWHEEWARCGILGRLQLAEWCPQAVGSLIPQMGQVKFFSWVQGKGADAVAVFEEGWAAIVWSGLLESESHLTRRLRGFHESLRDEWGGYDGTIGEHWKTSIPRAKPGIVIFIVPDHWQREIVRRATEGVFYPVQVWCIADGSVTGATDVGESLDMVNLSVYTRDLGGWPWHRRLEWSPWGPNFPSPITYQLLLAIAQWPGSTLSLICRMLGKGPRSQSVKTATGLLRQGGFVDRTQVKNYHLHWLSERGVFVLCRLDGVGRKYIDGRVRNLWGTREIPVHDQEVNQVLADLAFAGLPVANGWRIWEEWSGGALAPDGAVLFEDSPYDPGWHYYEGERTARRTQRVEEKAHNWISRKRPNDWPVLFSLWDDEAERILQAIGREHGLKLLTTTRERLDRCGALGPCWSMYGEIVTLG